MGTSCVQVAHFLAATDFTLWAAHLCATAPSLNRNTAPETLPSEQLSVPVRNKLQRREQQAQAGAGQCSALELLDAEGADVAAAVLAAHPVLSSAVPLGRRLARLPQRLHLAAARTAARNKGASESEPTLDIDITDASTCSQVAQVCTNGSQLALHRLRLWTSDMVRGSVQGEQATSASVKAVRRIMLQTCKRLQHLELHGPAQHAQQLVHDMLANALRCSVALHSLRSVTLTRCDLCVVAGAPVAALRSLLCQCLLVAQPTLTALELSNCEGISVWQQHETADQRMRGQQVTRRIGAIPGLQKLCLSGSKMCRPQSFSEFTQLTALRVLDCSNMHSAQMQPEFDASFGNLVAVFLPTVTALTSLNLSGNPLAQLAASIAQSLRSMLQLAHLALRSCGLDTQAVQHIAGALAQRDLAQLQSLDVSANPACGDEGHVALAETVLPHATALTRLDVRNTGVRAWQGGAIHALLPALSSLRSVGQSSAPADVLQPQDQPLHVALAHFSSLAMSESTAAAAAAESAQNAVMRMSHITEYDVDINPPGLAILGAYAVQTPTPFLSSTERFSVISEPFPESDASGEAYWTAMCRAGGLTELRFACGAAAASALAQNLWRLSRLQVLSFAGCQLGSVCGGVMQAAARLPQLAHLDLSNCKLTDAELAACAECVPQTTELRRLVLSNNSHTAAAFVSVVQALVPCRHLQHLLAGQSPQCELNAEQIATVGDELYTCEELVELELSQADCTCADLHALLPGVLVSIVP